jgi:hypothetical protein
MLNVIKNKLPFICIVLTGCMQSSFHVNEDGQPDWLNAEPANYPNASYMYATGSASKAEVARDRALGNLAKIFESQVRESSTTTQDVQTRKSEGEESVQSTARIASRVHVHTDRMINGARIAEQWQNPDDMTHYALAVLDRTQAGNNIRSEINRLDRETAFIIANADSRQQTLQKVADLQDAIVMQTERESLQKTLKIIDLNGTGKPSGWSLAELIEQQEQSLKSLNMRAVVLVDSVGGLDRILQAAMANAGFVQSSGGVGFTLSASMETQDAMYKEGWYWLRGALVVRLADPDGTILGNKSWPLKVSSVQQNQLNERMLAEIDNKLKSELKSAVLGFATGGQ